jgi:hypothetical protein
MSAEMHKKCEKTIEELVKSGHLKVVSAPEEHALATIAEEEI